MSSTERSSSSAILKWLSGILAAILGSAGTWYVINRVFNRPEAELTLLQADMSFPEGTIAGEPVLLTVDFSNDGERSAGRCHITWIPGGGQGEIRSPEFGISPGERLTVPEPALETTYPPGEYTWEIRSRCQTPEIIHEARSDVPLVILPQPEPVPSPAPSPITTPTPEPTTPTPRPTVTFPHPFPTVMDFRLDEGVLRAD